MSTFKETAYPRLNAEPSPKELKDSFTPTADELAFAASVARRPVPRAVALMQLKLFQRLGQFSSVANAPLVIRVHIAQHANMAVIIAENLRHEQRKIIKYNHLVANMVILHNVVGMSRVLKDMREEGVAITPEMLAGLAPLRPGHINRFGDYTLDFRGKISPLNFDMGIIPKES